MPKHLSDPSAHRVASIWLCLLQTGTHSRRKDKQKVSQRLSKFKYLLRVVGGQWLIICVSMANGVGFKANRMCPLCHCFGQQVILNCLSNSGVETAFLVAPLL